jgi:hypothetical protein
MFGQGYGEIKERIEKNPQYTRMCFNCNYLVESPEDPTVEICSNNNVLEFDMVVDDGGRIYCHYWKPVRKRASK